MLSQHPEELLPGRASCCSSSASIVWGKVKHQDRVRDVVDPLKLKVPVFGTLFQKIALSRFARNLGTMMRSGVPILQSLEIVAGTTGNVVLARAIRDVQESVRTGETIAGPLKNHPVFPPMVVQMMAVGEDTGALDQMLDEDQRVLRPGGRGDDRGADRPDRAADDRVPRCGRRLDDRRACTCRSSRSST